jgi:hypothetical protein
LRYDDPPSNQLSLSCSQFTLPVSSTQVNVSDLGLVTPAGKVIWGKYAQVTNNPENDGCINAVLLV